MYSHDPLNEYEGIALGKGDEDYNQKSLFDELELAHMRRLAASLGYLSDDADAEIDWEVGHLNQFEPQIERPESPTEQMRVTPEYYYSGDIIVNVVPPLPGEKEQIDALRKEDEYFGNGHTTPAGRWGDSCNLLESMETKQSMSDLQEQLQFLHFLQNMRPQDFFLFTTQYLINTLDDSSRVKVDMFETIDHGFVHYKDITQHDDSIKSLPKRRHTLCKTRRTGLKRTRQGTDDSHNGHPSKMLKYY